jgi:hypothetical protein
MGRALGPLRRPRNRWRLRLPCSSGLRMPDLPPPVPAIAFNLASAGIVERHRPDQGPQMLVRGELATGRVRL